MLKKTIVVLCWMAGLLGVTTDLRAGQITLKVFNQNNIPMNNVKVYAYRGSTGTVPAISPNPALVSGGIVVINPANDPANASIRLIFTNLSNTVTYSTLPGIKGDTGDPQMIIVVLPTTSTVSEGEYVAEQATTCQLPCSQPTCCQPRGHGLFRRRCR